MTLFVQLEVTWADHPKIMHVGLDGAGLHALVLCTAKRMESDGILHRAHLHRLGASDELIGRLVDVGLLDEIEGDRFRPHGWHDRNPSQGAIDAIRTAKRASGMRGNHARWGHKGLFKDCPICHRDNADTPSSSHGAIGVRSGCDPTGSPKSESESETDISRASARRAQIDADFAAWWEQYPRRVGKQRAIKAYRQARRKADAEALLDAVQHQKSTAWARREIEHIPHPTTWLNEGRWEDEDQTQRPVRTERTAVNTTPAGQDW